MNKKERVMSVLEGKTPDRLPVGFWFHFDGPQSEGEACVRAHLDFYRRSGIDLLKIMSDGLLYPFYQPIDSAGDWAKLQPLPRDDPFFTETIRRCARINEELNGDCYTFYNFFAPFTFLRAAETFTPNALNGRSKDETVMAHLRENEAAVLHALDVIAEDLAYLAERVIREGGCLGIYQSLQGAEKGRMTAGEYARWIAPSDLKVINAFNQVSSYNILHMCSWAGYPNHLEYWRDFPGRIKNWGTGIEGLSLAQGKEFFPGSVLLGGLDNRRTYPLFAGSREEVQNAVRGLLQEMGDTPFIVGADCTVPSDIDLERIQWVLEALQN